MTKAAFTLFSCLAFFTGTAFAQRQPDGPLAPGTRVRLASNGQRLIGAVHSLTMDSIALQLRQQQVMRFPLAGLMLEQSNGRESRWTSAGRWAFRAGVAMAVVGMLAPLNEADETDPYRCITEACPSRAESMVGGAFWGALMGGGVGAFIPRERWVTVSFPLPHR